MKEQSNNDEVGIFIGASCAYRLRPLGVGQANYKGGSRDGSPARNDNDKYDSSK